jgi:CHASE3 domain sensor protein
MRTVRDLVLRYFIWFGLIIPVMFSLSACSKSDDGSDLADAITTTPEKTQFLRDFFNGNSDENSIDSAANTQNTLLIAILAVVTLILIVVTIRLFTNKKTD